MVAPKANTHLPAATITHRQAREALLRSGYLIESRIESLLWKRNYNAYANVAYPDPITAKSRELDVYALSVQTLSPAKHWIPGKLDLLWWNLMIECVNNPQPLLFITKESEIAWLNYDKLKVAGIPLRVPDPKSPRAWLSLAEYLRLDRYHHYAKGRFATQFCSFTEKNKGKGEWMATHVQDHFDAFAGLVAATQSRIDEVYSSWVKTHPEEISINVFYPIVVVQGKLMEARPSKRSVRLLTAKHIQFQRSAYVGGKEIDYQIDVVAEAEFPKLLDTIDNEMQRTARLLRRRYGAVRKATDRLGARLARVRSPERIREVLESR